MKRKYNFPAILSILICIMACKKESNNSAVAGKWHETKLRLYGLDNTGAKIYDTTFLQPFTSSDYIQFNANNTCTIGLDYYYYPNRDGNEIPPQKITPVSSTLNYKTVGSKFVLTFQHTLANPGGFPDPLDTISTIDAHTLFFRSISKSNLGGYISVSESYYTK